MYPDVGRFHDMREAINAGQTQVPCNVRNLRLSNSPGFNHESTRNLGPGFSFLEVFVPRLVNLQTLDLDHSLSDEPPPLGYPPMAVERLMASFGALPSLRTLILGLDGLEKPPHRGLPLESLSNLITFRVDWLSTIRPDPQILSQISGLVGRSPSLESFTFTIPASIPLEAEFGQPVTLEELLDALSLLTENHTHFKSLETRGVVVTGETFQRHSRHFRRLERLRVRFDPSPFAPANIGGVCEVLSAERIYLKHIHIDALHHPSTMYYLSSYSGIEHLALKPGHPPDNSPQLVEQFFSTVLPRHSGSLKSLRIGANLRTAWSRALTMEQLRALSRCQELEYICCWLWITSADVAAEKSDVAVSFGGCLCRTRFS
ncbi:hypothetical protein AN958_11928 [Leucoagaricus sp. SymC.cos]|nr:hypothetical protein AN958_11928 [Leucoagaricus sp. SymC.cos]